MLGRRHRETHREARDNGNEGAAERRLRLQAKAGRDATASDVTYTLSTPRAGRGRSGRGDTQEVLLARPVGPQGAIVAWPRRARARG